MHYDTMNSDLGPILFSRNDEGINWNHTINRGI